MGCGQSVHDGSRCSADLDADAKQTPTQHCGSPSSAKPKGGKGHAGGDEHISRTPSTRSSVSESGSHAFESGKRPGSGPEPEACGQSRRHRRQSQGASAAGVRGDGRTGPSDGVDGGKDTAGHRRHSKGKETPPIHRGGVSGTSEQGTEGTSSSGSGGRHGTGQEAETDTAGSRGRWTSRPGSAACRKEHRSRSRSDPRQHGRGAGRSESGSLSGGHDSDGGSERRRGGHAPSTSRRAASSGKNSKSSDGVKRDDKDSNTRQERSQRRKDRDRDRNRDRDRSRDRDRDGKERKSKGRHVGRSGRRRSSTASSGSCSSSSRTASSRSGSDLDSDTGTDTESDLSSGSGSGSGSDSDSDSGSGSGSGSDSSTRSGEKKGRRRRVRRRRKRKSGRSRSRSGSRSRSPGSRTRGVDSSDDSDSCVDNNGSAGDGSAGPSSTRPGPGLKFDTGYDPVSSETDVDEMVIVDGDSPFLLAARNNDIQHLWRLLIPSSVLGRLTPKECLHNKHFRPHIMRQMGLMLRTIDSRGCNALFVAVQHGAVDVVSALVGIDNRIVHQRRPATEDTPLHEAARQCSVSTNGKDLQKNIEKICDILVKAGAALGQRNVFGRTPSELAAHTPVHDMLSTRARRESRGSKQHKKPEPKPAGGSEHRHGTGRGDVRRSHI